MRRATVLLLLGLEGCSRGEPCAIHGVCLEVQEVPMRAFGQAFASADLDADGTIEFVSAGRSGVSIRQPGTSRYPTVWPVPGPTQGMALADFDGDGKFDLATALPERGSIATAPIESVDVVGPLVEVQLDAKVGLLVAADFDDDGDGDLIAAEHDGARLFALTGGPHGLAEAGALELAGEAAALVWGQFRESGPPEVAATLPSTGQVELFELSDGVPRRLRTAWTSTFPVALVATDVDGDGRTDLAAADPLEQKLWVGISDGAGGWSKEQVWSVGESPSLLLARRGVGAVELVGVSADGSVVTVIDPHTGGVRIANFTPSRIDAGLSLELDLFARGEEVVVADRDGKLRALAEKHGLSVMSLWAEPRGRPSGRMARGDLDGDGGDELVAEDTLTGELVVYAAAGAVFGELTRVPVPGRLAGLSALPRADGRADLVAWTEVEADPQRLVVWSWAQGKGLAEVASLVPEVPIRDAVAARLDIGGWGDLATTVVLADSEAIDVMIRTPEGGFVAGERLIEAAKIDAVVATQLDTDTRDDLWIVADDQLQRYRSIPETVEPVSDVTADAWHLAAADVDGDDEVDLLACSKRGLTLLRGSGLGLVGVPTVMSHESCRRVHACDVDGDAIVEVVVERNDDERQVLEVLGVGTEGGVSRALLRGARDGTATAARCAVDGLSLWTGGPLGSSLHAVSAGDQFTAQYLDQEPLGDLAVGDLDGDGFDDVATHDGRRIIVTKADGAGGFGAVRGIAFAGDIDRFALAEFDGQTGSELLALARADDEDAGGWRVWSIRDGSLIERAVLTHALSPVLADFDGDGRDEVVAFADGEAVLVTPGLDGAATTVAPLGLEGYEPSLAHRGVDIDGDGRADLVGGGSDGVRVYRSRGEGGFEPARRWEIPTYEDLLGVGDVDGDHVNDLVALVGDTIHACPGDGDGGQRGACTTSTWSLLSSSYLQAPLIGDVDLDGAADLMWFAAGSVYVAPGDGGGRFREVPGWYLEQGSPGNTVVPVRLARDVRAWVIPGRDEFIVLREGGEQ